MTPSGIEIFSNFSIILLKDKKMVQKINELIKDINRNGLSKRNGKTRTITIQKSME